MAMFLNVCWYHESFHMKLLGSSVKIPPSQFHPAPGDGLLGFPTGCTQHSGREGGRGEALRGGRMSGRL